LLSLRKIFKTNFNEINNAPAHSTRLSENVSSQRSWWVRLMSGDDSLAADYVKAHGRKVADVMTQNVITATPETPLDEIATLLEKNLIKRVPIVKDGQLVGIVSRAKLIQAVASAPKGLDIPLSDSTIRDKLLAHLKAQPWVHTDLLNVTVNDGAVSLWGITTSETERKAIRVATSLRRQAPPPRRLASTCRPSSYAMIRP
jgi:CBS-domain-containing membrane protein